MIDHPAWVALQENITKNVPEYITLIGGLTVAAIVTMPIKAPLIPAESRLQELWTWLRDALQTAVPAARVNHYQVTPPPNPSTAADPPTTQK